MDNKFSLLNESIESGTFGDIVKSMNEQYRMQESNKKSKKLKEGIIYYLMDDNGVCGETYSEDEAEYWAYTHDGFYVPKYVDDDSLMYESKLQESNKYEKEYEKSTGKKLKPEQKKIVRDYNQTGNYKGSTLDSRKFGRKQGDTGEHREADIMDHGKWKRGMQQGAMMK